MSSEIQELLPTNQPNDHGGPLSVLPSEETRNNHNENPNNERLRRSVVVTIAIAILWISMIGFGAFALFQYVLPALLQGDWKRWDITDAGLYRSNTRANKVMVSHLVCGVILQILGPIQLIPSFRRNYIQVHRILGRIYIGAALGASGFATLYVLLYRTSRLWIHEDIGNIIFGSAVFGSATMSLWYIRKGDIETHKVWSVRLFLAVFGATSFRVATVPYFLAVILGAPPSQLVVNSFFYILVLPSWLGYELIRNNHLKVLSGTNTIFAASTYWAILTLIVFVGAWLPAMLSQPSLQTGLFDDD